MALASPALALASVAPQTFDFARRAQVKLQVRFYLDAAATSGSEIPSSAGGDRTITGTLKTQVSDVALEYQTRPLDSAIVLGSQLCIGATWYFFDLADGASSLTIAATGGANPAGANSYRIILDVEANQ